MKCHELDEMLTPYVMGDLDEALAEQVRAHLESCKGCQAAVQELELTLGLLRDAMAAHPVEQTELEPERVEAVKAERQEEKPTLRRISGQTKHAKRAKEETTSRAWWQFRIVEVAAALLILGLMAAVMAPRLGGKASMSKEAAMRADEKQREVMRQLVMSESNAELDDPVGLSRRGVREMEPFAGEAPDARDSDEVDYELAMVDNVRKAQFRSYDQRIVGNELSVDAPEEEPIELTVLEVAESEEELYRFGGAKDDKELDGTMRGRDVPRDLAQVAGERNQAVGRGSVADKSEVFYEGAEFAQDGQLAQGKSSDEETLLAASAFTYGAGAFMNMDDDRRESEIGKQVASEPQSLKKSKKHAEFKRGPAQQDMVGGVAGSDMAVAYNAAPEKAPHRSNLPAPVSAAPPADGDGDVISPGGRHSRHMGWEDRASEISAGAYDDRAKVNGAKVVDSYEAGAGVGDEADLVTGMVASRIEKPQPVTVSEAKGRLSSDREASVKTETKLGADFGVEDFSGEIEAEDALPQELEAEKEPHIATFKAHGVNPFVLVSHAPLSTFSMDVDTASYTLTRNYIKNGRLPPAEAVRTEEFVNFFDYGYAPPKRDVFAVSATYAPSPFARGYHLLKIGVKGQKIGREHRKSAVLTFVIDTSGSMNTPDRLGLLQESLRMLVDQLDAGDRVAIVQYDSEARLVLEHTPVFKKDEILKAIDTMQTSGSTHLEEGLKLGYDVASKGFRSGAMNRVLLLSDGVANLGSADADEILGFVERSRDQGVYCSVYGFGIGTYDDEMLETLANKGDGSYHFIDSSKEAKRVFVDELSATLNVIAKDAKIQVEFNPERVKSYRQVGYENRLLTEEQFRDDSVDAGEVGSGQSVTALYELDLQGDEDAPIGTVRVRYRDASSGEVTEFAHNIEASDMISDFEKTGPHFKLATAVAEYAEILRGSPFADGSTYEDVAKVLRPVSLELKKDQRVQELLRMVHGSSTLPRAEYGKKDIVLE